MYNPFELPTIVGAIKKAVNMALLTSCTILKNLRVCTAYPEESQLILVLVGSTHATS